MTSGSQTVFVTGLINGVGISFGVSDAIAAGLAAKASEEEKPHLEQLRRLPQTFLSQSHLNDVESMRDALFTRCKGNPTEFAAREFTNVLSGAKN